MSRHVHPVYNVLSPEEAAFCAVFARTKDPRAAAIAAGYPRQSAARIGEMLFQSFDIQSEVLRLCGSRDRSAFVARFNAIDNAAFAEHVRGNLPVLIQRTRERLAATRLPPPGELVIARAPAPKGATAP